VAIEWLAISAAVIPHIKTCAADRAEKLAEKSADNVLAKIYRRVVPDEKLVKANEAFVSRFGKELDSAMDLATLNAETYQEALKLFLGNPSVQDAIQAPLDGRSELNWQLLRNIWGELRTPQGEALPVLPADFDWPKVARTYGQSIQRQMLHDPDLRPVIQAIADLRTAEATEKIATDMRREVGPARPFDLTRYADAIRTAYAHLKLGSIDTDWARYERRVRLESVYVPQSAKQALPPRNLTRDYLRKLEAEGRTARGATSNDLADPLQRSTSGHLPPREPGRCHR
jgi:hypothetical protein